MMCFLQIVDGWMDGWMDGWTTQMCNFQGSLLIFSMVFFKTLNSLPFGALRKHPKRGNLVGDSWNCWMAGKQRRERKEVKLAAFLSHT